MCHGSFCPPPLDVTTRFFQLLTSPFAGSTLPMHVASSFQRYAMGVLLAAAVGVPLGLLMGWFRLLDDIVTPDLRWPALHRAHRLGALRGALFGTGIGGPVMIIFAGALSALPHQCLSGARFVEPRLIEAGRMLGTPNTRMILEVLLPAAVPSIIAGLRVSAGLGWQSLVGAELIVAAAGVGFMMVQAQGSVQTTTVMAGMIAIGIIGMLIDVLLRRGEGWLRRRRGLEA